jgi:hypothetical protein
MMAMTDEAPRDFRPNSRSESEIVHGFLERTALTPEEVAWQQALPVVGSPSPRRLRAALAEAGLADIDPRLSAEGQDLSFKMRVTDRVGAHDSDSLVRLWIAAFRAAGFRVGFKEVGIIGADGSAVYGQALTGPIAEIAERGAP